MWPNFVLHVDLHALPGGDGSLLRPYSSIERAIERVEDRAFDANQVTILLGPGEYRVMDPIKITPALTHDGHTTVTFQPSKPGTVTLKGSARFHPDWKPYSGSIFKTQVAVGDFDQLFVNGRLQVLARYPNYDPKAVHYHGVAADAISDERVARWKDPTGGYVHALHAAEWGDLHYRILGKDEHGKLKLEGGWQNNRPTGMHGQIRFVEGVFEELDAPGEWYLDRKTSTLYYWPPHDVDLAKASYEGASATCLFNIEGTPEKPVTGVRFDGLKFEQTARTFMLTKEPLLRSDWRIYRGGVVHVKNARSCAITNCDFQDIGGNAIFFDGFGRDNHVQGCHIADVGGSGVCFVGSTDAVRSPLLNYDLNHSYAEIDKTPGPKTDDYPADSSVSDCLIERIGQIEKQAAGVEIDMAARIRVSHCTVHDTPRAGINIGDGCWGGHVVEDSDIFDTVKETGDHGSFNSWGRDRYWGLSDGGPDPRALSNLDAVEPTTLRHNRWRCDHGWDIDLDDGSSHYVIRDNLCLAGGIKNREGYDRVVENNIMVQNSFHPHVWFDGSGDVFRHNIVFTPYRPIGMPKTWGDAINDNFLHEPGHKLGPATQLAALSGQDAQSLVGDADFRNPSKGDYRVKADSPALKVGFRNFNMDFGVTSARLRKIAAKPDFGFLTISEEGVPLPEYAWLGAKTRGVRGLGERSALGAPGEVGALLIEVAPGSVAASLGLRPQDLILAVDAQAVKDAEAFVKLWDGLAKGTTVHLTVLRSQRSQTVTVTK